MSKSDNTPSPTPEVPAPADSIAAAKAHADALTAQAALDAKAAFEETLARIGAPAEYLKAGKVLEDLLPWKPKAEEALKNMTMPPAVRRTILAYRPGLCPLFETLDRWADEVTALALTQIRDLQDQRQEYEALTAENLLPQPGRDCWMPTPFGLVVNSKLWKLRCALGNHRPAADVPEAIKHLEAAYAELAERLAAPVAVSSRPAPAVVMTPRQDADASQPAVIEFNVYDRNR
jgi:hypothetical protein